MFPLRVRSFFSLLRGTASPRALCRRARELGYRGLALTDRDNLYGLWEFLPACTEFDLKPIIGAEITEPATGRSLVALVENAPGFENLCRLLSKRHLEAGFSLLEQTAALGTGLLLLCNRPDHLAALHGAGCEVAADLGAGPSAAARTLRKLAGQLDVPAVATPDSDLAGSRERDLACLLRAIATGGTFAAAREESRRHPARRLAPASEYRDRFAGWPETVSATGQLAERCSFSGPEYGTVMPPWQDAKGQEPEQALRRAAYAGARQRYGTDLGETVVERLEYELGIICRMDYATYFLVVRDIVHRRDETGRIRQRRICGRGSGAASLVAYCLGITNVCPIGHNLYFERFLHPERRDPPDIDIDFPWDERDEVLARVLADHRGHAAMVCSHILFQPRMAIRETAKAFGLPDTEISRLTGRIPWTFDRSGSSDLAGRLADLPVFRDLELAGPWPEILDLARQLVGLPRHLSVHPGGVVITPKPISHYAPVQRATKGIPIIQWEKDGAEEAGLVKIDLLGNRSLAVIRDAVAALRAQGRAPDELAWHPEDDPATRQLVAAGRTVGCFYIESPAMRLLQQKAGSGDFEQLVIQSSLIRPAANEFVREYVRRLHGGDWHPLCLELADVLSETMGLMVYQEDVSRVAVALAGFSHGDADRLRKIIARKDRQGRLENYRTRFSAGCAARGIAGEVIDQVWRMIMSFAGYSFCKPHSASYARVSFQAAYLKSHAPAEFMAAVIANGGGYYPAFGYVSEAKRLGLRILPPDVRHAGRRWTGRRDELRVGLQAVKGLSGGFIDKVLAERVRAPFTGPEDFFARTAPDDTEARALIHAGGLDGLDRSGNRTALLWRWTCHRRLRREDGQPSLLPALPAEPPPLAPPAPLERARREFAVLGFLCAGHPLDFCRTVPGCIHVSDLPDRAGRRVRLRGWLISGKLVSTRTGEAMEFLTFEDETGLVEATFFPATYERYAHILRSGRGFLLEGLVEEDYGAVTLTVQRVEALEKTRNTPHTNARKGFRFHFPGLPGGFPC